jgi:threonine/homoserine/homoserine lactone efflux protein
MQIRFFIEGLIFGFIVAVPVGPIGILCISRTLSGGPTYGLFSGLGVATADAIYAGIAALGLTLVTSFLVREHTWVRLIGGLFLCYLGLKTFFARPAGQEASSSTSSFLGAYTSTFFMTATNPATILSFVAIYAGFGVGSLSGNYVAAALLTSGVFVGSALWWFLLSGGLLLFRAEFAQSGLRWVHKVSGVIIVVFGMLVLFGFIEG